MNNKLVLQIEGLAILLISLYFYSYQDFSWLLFLLLFFVPDSSMVGYLVNSHLGAKLYNLFHNYIIPIILILMGVALSINLLVLLGLIWTAHIGMDRMIGYGLKYPTGFKDTHLTRV